MSAMIERRYQKSTPAPTLYAETSAMGDLSFEMTPFAFKITQAPGPLVLSTIPIPDVAAISAQALNAVRKVIETSCDALFISVMPRPSRYSTRLVEMAARAVEQLAKRENEDINAWARALASDLANATD